MTYECRFCGEELIGFECSCEERTKAKHLWGSQGERKRLKSQSRLARNQINKSEEIEDEKN